MCILSSYTRFWINTRYPDADSRRPKKSHRTNARGGSRLMIHGKSIRNQGDSRDCITSCWTKDAPSHETADLCYSADIHMHTALRDSLWRRDIKIISKPQWLIYERARRRGRNERKGRPADMREKRGARKLFCPRHSRHGPYSRERATQRGTPALFIHALNLTNVLRGRS